MTIWSVEFTDYGDVFAGERTKPNIASVLNSLLNACLLKKTADRENIGKTSGNRISQLRTLDVVDEGTPPTRIRHFLLTNARARK